jgi:ribonuclease BN (tRNA processing enzyme)
MTVGDARVTFRPTVHYVPCWAIRVEEDGTGRALLYTADTGPAADLSEFGRGVQVLVAEGTLLEPGDEPFAERGHLTAGEAGDLATVIGAETLVLSHLWHELGRDRYEAAAAARYAGRLVPAEAGTTIGW